MAPRRASFRPTFRNKANFVSSAWTGVLKRKSENSTLYRLKNGVLDISRKWTEHLDATESNSKSPLLRLPPEIRNRIWEYTVGGKVLDVTYFQRYRSRRYVEEVTTISKDSFPQHSHALLQACRQIYAETALLPFSKNTFRFEREQAFEWARQLLKVQQNLLEKVHIVTHRAQRLYGWNETGSSKDLYLPHAFPISVFPNVKQVVVEIRRSACHDIDAAAHEGGPNAKWSSKQYRTRVTSNMIALVDHIHEEKPDARVVFLHTNLCESNTETGLTESEYSDEEQADDSDNSMSDAEGLGEE
ncbi:hypothetical protein B5807_04087 [Epicoccum nigrum]|uniref:DUF7730 domain-containing protein n=1 Tax=Epicoccum nigrum TaxID=105696 RepID=A0A1Y2M3R7_EPING|nr:hypothetical protein B5807_04087 [Epicoccum nigrum]